MRLERIMYIEVEMTGNQLVMVMNSVANNDVLL